MRGAYFQYYYNCKIRSRNKDGTFVVDYEDGEEDPSVEWQRLHKDYSSSKIENSNTHTHMLRRIHFTHSYTRVPTHSIKSMHVYK